MAAKKKIFILSDATGLTAEMAVNAALSQFKNVEVEINRMIKIRDKTKIVNTIRSISEVGGIIVYTFVSSELRKLVLSEIAERKVPTVDLMGPLLDSFTRFLETHPLEKAGIQRELNDSYFKAIEAIEYTVNHDDGKDPNGLHLADIVLVGISRTSKTPLSIFLSNQYFLSVANIPIILKIGLPPQLFGVEKNRIIGLTISAERLMEIRKARMKRANFKAPPKYADYNNIVRELEYSNWLFTKNGWIVIDVTEKSIEETASEILRLMRNV